MPNIVLVGEIDKALEAHAEWRRKLTAAIRSGTLETAPHDIACDDKCVFGQWLHGPTLDAATKAGKPFQVTRRVHAEFHETASRVAKLAQEGQRGQAFALLDNEYTARSETLTRALNKWRSEAMREG